MYLGMKFQRHVFLYINNGDEQYQWALSGKCGQKVQTF